MDMKEINQMNNLVEGITHNSVKNTLTEAKVSENKKKEALNFAPKYKRGDDLDLWIKKVDGYNGGNYEVEAVVKVDSKFFEAFGVQGMVVDLNNHLYKNYGISAMHPSVGGLKDKSRKGVKTLKFHYMIRGAEMAYALGYDLSQYSGSSQLADNKAEVSKRKKTFEVFKSRMTNFRNAVDKAQMAMDQDEKSADWEAKYKKDWMKIGDEAKKKGMTVIGLMMNEHTITEKTNELLEWRSDIDQFLESTEDLGLSSESELLTEGNDKTYLYELRAELENAWPKGWMKHLLDDSDVKKHASSLMKSLKKVRKNFKNIDELTGEPKE